MDGWVSVDDRLPETPGYMGGGFSEHRISDRLILDVENLGVVFGFYIDGVGFSLEGHNDDCEVLNWMLIPERPPIRQKK